MVGIANASSKTVENGRDDLYANPIINNDLKIKSPFNCSIQRYAKDIKTIK